MTTCLRLGTPTYLLSQCRLRLIQALEGAEFVRSAGIRGGAVRSAVIGVDAALKGLAEMEGSKGGGFDGADGIERVRLRRLWELKNSSPDLVGGNALYEV